MQAGKVDNKYLWIKVGMLVGPFRVPEATSAPANHVCRVDALLVGHVVGTFDGTLPIPHDESPMASRCSCAVVSAASSVSNKCSVSSAPRLSFVPATSPGWGWLDEAL